MSLYWCLLADGRELDGIDAGSYADFGRLRRVIGEQLEGGVPGSRFPTLMQHSDCDGEWSPAACGQLEAELAAIIAELKRRPPLPSGWDRPAGPADPAGPEPANAFECFLDADGQYLLERLRFLAALARHLGQPVLFQ